ncbi:MAG: hypothetical protein ACHRXM_27310 [Isosphaerales bacterium]
MKRRLAFNRSRPGRQQTFEFIERSGRHDRWFKLTILGATLLAIAVVAVVMPRGRYLIASLPSLARQGVRLTLGLPTPRAEIEQEWRRFRAQGIADSHRALIRVYQGEKPPYQALMRYAGLDPVHGLLRWGNYNRTLLLPSTVFEPDDTGRSYRLRPCTQSIWLRQLTIKGVLMFFLVPDRPDLREAIRGTTGIPVERSRQSTNSWGLRGPEPDTGAPLRGIVLGDSYMQGLFIGDDDTPPECLRRHLETHLKTKASILNTGHLGYSPEQYYYSLLAFADRFPAQFVIVSVFSNDFGDLFEVLDGKGDWVEGKYWLDRIADFCRGRNWPCLFVSVPIKSQMLNRRKTAFYPGAISNILNDSAMTFLDPTDVFVNANLDLVNEADRRGRRPYGCPLFNDDISDGHFSALGAEVWAGAVGRRLVLLLEQNGKITNK